MMRSRFPVSCLAILLVLLAADAAAEDKKLPKDPEASITGIVLDDRELVAGAAVQAYYMAFAGWGWGMFVTEEVRTDEDGRFQLLVPRRRMSELKVLARTADSQRMGLFEIGASSDAEEGSERYRIADPERIKNLEVRLSPAAPQKIDVVDDKGKPIQGAHVGAYLTENWQIASTKTDKDGAAVIRLPATRPYGDIFAWKPGTGLDYGRAQRIDGANPKLKLTLRKSPAVKVRALDAITNQPLPDVTLFVPIPGKPRSRGSVAGLHYGFHINATTDKDGLATIDWLPDWMAEGRLEVWGRHSEYKMVMGNDRRGQFPRNLKLKMRPLVKLRGRVLHQDGKPAAGIVVEAANGYVDQRDQTRTDQNGEYVLSPFSELKCVVIVVDEKWGAEPQTEFAVEQSGLSAKVKDIRLAPAKRVHGRLTTEEKTPVPGEQIWLHIYGPPRGERELPNKNVDKQAPHATLTTWTDKNGDYEFHIGPAVFMIKGPKDLESADGRYFARGYSYWSKNLPAKENSLEFDLVRPVWTEMP